MALELARPQIIVFHFRARRAIHAMWHISQGIGELPICSGSGSLLNRSLLRTKTESASARTHTHIHTLFTRRRLVKYSRQSIPSDSIRRQGQHMGQALFLLFGLGWLGHRHRSSCGPRWPGRNVSAFPARAGRPRRARLNTGATRPALLPMPGRRSAPTRRTAGPPVMEALLIVCVCVLSAADPRERRHQGPLGHVRDL